MPLIFDSFPTAADAAAFAQAVVTEQPDRSAALYADAELAERDAIFPFVVRPFIVLVSRSETDSPSMEEALTEGAQALGGRFAGT